MGSRRSTMATGAGAGARAGAGAPDNEVRLTGRVAAGAQERELPSGDLLVSWRIVVARAAPRGGVNAAVRTPTVDTLDCVAFLAGPRRMALTLAAGDVITVEGALHRRFWRTPTGPTSKCEVVVSKLRRLARAEV